MSSTIQDQLKATGTADVLVFLQTGDATSLATTAVKAISKKVIKTAVTALKGLFVSDEEAQDTSLRHLSHLKGLLKEGKSLTTKVLASASLKMTKATPKYRVFENLGVMLGMVDRAGFKQLKESEHVAEISGVPNLSLIRPVSTKKVTLGAVAGADTLSWGLKRLGIEQLWAQGLTGKDILVGHLDTGIDGQHPALQGAVSHFAEFDLSGDLVPNATAHDSDEHGTHTAGTIAGRAVNGRKFGVAPEALLASALVIEGGDVIARILGGMDWAVGLGVRILNMSLGLRGWQEDFLPLTKLLRQRNVLPVFAVGNEGPGTSRSPGNYAEALSVGASDAEDFVADFSSSQRFTRPKDPRVPDLVGPGANVLSCTPNGGFAEISGTSMATPHIAGLAALLMQAHPDKSIAKIEQAIFKGCTLLPTMQVSRANRGLPDGPKALAHLEDV